MKASIIFLFLFFALAYAKVTLGRNDMTRVGHGAFKRSSQQGQAQSQSDGDSDTMHQRQSQDLESHSQGSIERTNQGSQCNNKCPAKELMQPCTCYEHNDGPFLWYEKNTTENLKKFFNSARKNLNDKKCFDGLHADFPYSQTTENILDENQFSDFTLNRISMSGLTKIHTKAFGKTASTLKTFWSVQKSVIGHSPPKYDLWKSISQLTKLNYLGLGTNVTEIPENCISPVNGHESQLKQLHLDQYFQNPFRPKWTIKSGAFQNLNQLKSLELWGFFNKIETGAFKLNKKSDEKLNISIVSCSHFSGDLFEEGAFDGIQRPVYIDLFLRPHKTDYIPESSFKSLMDNPQNQFQFYDTQVDCDDCRNDWLIRDNRRDQAGGLTCADGSKLFDDSTVKRFKSKCT